MENQKPDLERLTTQDIEKAGAELIYNYKSKKIYTIGNYNYVFEKIDGVYKIKTCWRSER